MGVNKERVQWLIDALESGKYIQGRDTLSTIIGGTGAHEDCCLGVACYVAKDRGLDLTVRSGTIVQFDDEANNLPERTREWYGFDDWDPLLRLRSTGRMNTATALNDSLKLSFHEIADAFRYTYIEDHEPTEKDFYHAENLGYDVSL